MERVKIIVAIIALLGAYSAGWKTKGWQVDSMTLIAEKVAKEAREEYRKRESQIAIDVQKAIKGSVLKERYIETRLQPIINREVYSNECIDSDGLDAINSMLRNLRGEG